MGNWMCSVQDAAHLAAVARDFCPFPDYSPSPLFNMLPSNSSLLLSEHYAAVQASLTPRQQQDFTRSLRSTFGREGKVSYGGVGIVALSLAVLFDTVARQVKGECVSDQEPVPGLFLRDPTGTYSPPVHTVSQYLRLVPHIANNPTRMRDETEKYLHEVNNTLTLAVDTSYAAQQFDDSTGVNLVKCSLMERSMVFYLNRSYNKTIDPNVYIPKANVRQYPDPLFKLNCDPEVAGEKFLTEMDSLGDRTKETFQRCGVRHDNKTVMKEIAKLQWFIATTSTMRKFDDNFLPAQREDFDLKANALGNWL